MKSTTKGINTNVKGSVKGSVKTSKNPSVVKSAGTTDEGMSVVDPEEITRLSNCIQDVFFNDVSASGATGDTSHDSSGGDCRLAAAASDFESFSSRMARASDVSASSPAKAAQAVDGELASAVAALRGRIAGSYDTRTLKGLLRGQVGLRVLIDVTSPVELRSYCTLLAVSADDVARLTSGDTTEGSFETMPLLTAVGTWAQNVREEASRGLADSAAAELAEVAFASLGGVHAFKLGRNMAKRIWDGIGEEIARGRPRKDHTDRLFKKDDVNNQVVV